MHVHIGMTDQRNSLLDRLVSRVQPVYDGQTGWDPRLSTGRLESMLEATFRALFGLLRTRSAPRRHDPRRDFDLNEEDDFEDDDEDDWWSYRLPWNRPDGGPWRAREWGITVKGTQHRRDAVETFIDDILDAENYDELVRFSFSVALEAEPDNSYDRNAIKVMGQTGARRGKLHLGYLPRNFAAKLAGQELPPIEVTQYFERGDFSCSGLKISILERRV